MEKIYIIAGLLVAVLTLLLIGGCEPGTQSCISSGGVTSTAMCCESVGDFPNTCLIGACGCSLENSHPVKICNCGANKCFDGSSCVPR